jgi:hypothetical protein
LPAQVRQLANWVRRIQPDKVQLNTAVRPPAEEYAMAVPSERLAELARMFKPPAEVVADHRGQRAAGESKASAEAILALVRRRPCTVEDIAHGLGLNPSETVKALAGLERRGKVLGERHGLEEFYRAATSTRGTPSCQAKPERNLPCAS